MLSPMAPQPPTAPRPQPRAEPDGASPIEMLHYDVLRTILSLLEPASLARAAAVCQRLREVATEDSLWRRLLAGAAAAAYRWPMSERQLASVTRLDVVALLSDSTQCWRELRRSRGRRLPSSPPPKRQPSTAVVGPLAIPGAVVPAKQMSLGSDGCSIMFVGRGLGGNRAIRCEPPLPTAPFTCLRAVAPFRDSGRSGVSGCPPPMPHAALASTAAEGACGRTAWQYEVALCHVAYYEVTIGGRPDQFGARDCIAIGLGSRHFPLAGKQPGWDRHSFGYHSDDGHVFHGSGSGLSSEPFGPTFRPGDVVGCGFSVISRKIFFTLNGRMVGIPFVAKSSHMPLYPIIGIDSHAPVRFNFGHQPFVFDVNSVPPTLHDTFSAASAAASLKAAIRCLVPHFGPTPAHP